MYAVEVMVVYMRYIGTFVCCLAQNKSAGPASGTFCMDTYIQTRDLVKNTFKF